MAAYPYQPVHSLQPQMYLAHQQATPHQYPGFGPGAQAAAVAQPWVADIQSYVGQREVALRQQKVRIALSHASLSKFRRVLCQRLLLPQYGLADELRVYVKQHFGVEIYDQERRWAAMDGQCGVF